MEKTNVMRILDRNKIEYRQYTHPLSGEHSGVEIAEYLGQNSSRVFKTLVTFAPKSGKNYVFMVPVENELDLKKASVAVKEKSVEMVKSKELFKLTGYVHGGCSPIGMKKQFETVIHYTAEEFETIFFSGGKIGCQTELSLNDLRKVISVKSADIVVE